jgi:pseudo-response regulator 5
MGEIVMREVESLRTEEDGGGVAAVVRWEKFLPRMSLRVLLVEADDSTRQIISALLRKCSFKVAAVCDGLQAWEVLKGRPEQIDLILTEVELPSISGYALLSLIAEHEICKNIPVIMMSSLDSVSTVYKCMLRGAADFLVKPLRKNELRNLWQHVWRRQASVSGGNVREESDAQQKVEATAENIATSNHSSGYMACLKRNRECAEKGSDAQSSCTKMSRRDLETEELQDLSQPKQTESLTGDGLNLPSQMQKESVKEIQQLPVNDCQVQGSRSPRMENEQTGNRENISEMRENDQAQTNSPREAIDLIGNFGNHQKFSCGTSLGLNDGANKGDSSPLLDLSLRRTQHSASVNQVITETQRVKQSDISAFSRYVNKTSQFLNSTSASICNQQNDYDTYSDRYASDNHGSAPNPQSTTNIQSGQTELHFPSPHRRVFPGPVPVKGIRYDNVSHNGFSSFFPQMICTQSAPQGQTFQGNSPNAKTEQTEQMQANFSSANDQTATSNFCTGNNINLLPVNRSTAECGNDNNTLVQDGSSNRSTLREAALNKFRMKRKDRCYEKKVRYESRKKLAEQRPRVKGQFVRQINSEPLPVELDNSMEAS